MAADPTPRADTRALSTSPPHAQPPRAQSMRLRPIRRRARSPHSKPHAPKHRAWLTCQYLATAHTHLGPPRVALVGLHAPVRAAEGQHPRRADRARTAPPVGESVFVPCRGCWRAVRRSSEWVHRSAGGERASATAWPENMQLCTPAILYVIIMYVFRTIVLAAVVGRPAYQFIDTVYVRE